MTELLLAFLSFFIGILVGLTGIGGASLITPMLIFVFGVPPSVAISSDAVAATLMKIVGSVKHWRQQTLDLEIVKWLTLGSLPGSLLGLIFLKFLRNSENLNIDHILFRLIGIIMLLVGSISLLDWLQSSGKLGKKMRALPKVDLTTYTGRILTISLGAFIGCLVSLTSLFSGLIFALILISFFQLDAHKLVGTDLSHASILLTFTSLGHLSLGSVSWALVLPIWCGSIPGVLVGAKLSHNVSSQALKAMIFICMLLVGFKCIYAT